MLIFFTEGAECRALQGAHKLLNTKFVPYIIMEFWSPHMHAKEDSNPSTCTDAEIKQMLQYLIHIGYMPYSIAKTHSVYSALGRIVSVDSLMKATQLENIFWIHKRAERIDNRQRTWWWPLSLLQ